jgi:NitT/TauT family transport system substrate-binding protein
MDKGKYLIWVVLFAILSAAVFAQPRDRQVVKAIYIPLADHYAGIVAFEKYSDDMQFADFRIERMKSWPLLRAYFGTGQADLAFVMSPLAMDMFSEAPYFRWVGLMHRDGNALAINDQLNLDVSLPSDRSSRKPDAAVAKAFIRARSKRDRPVVVGMPHLMATHTVVLYKYLKDQGLSLGLDEMAGKDVVAIEVSPPKSPSFIKKSNSRGIAAAFQQSLPWADVVETQGFGHVAWYSKDVLKWPPHGHVECIMLATDESIANKHQALQEVINYIHQAGQDIEEARRQGGDALIAISDMIRRHIPEHNEEAIVQSLRPDLNVINYHYLNVDKPGLRQIMDLAVEGGIIKEPVDIDAFANEGFATRVTLH